MKVVRLGKTQLLRAAIALTVLSSTGVCMASELPRPQKEEYLCGVLWDSRDAFQYLLINFGNPSRIELGSGAPATQTQGGGSTPAATGLESIPGLTGGGGGGTSGGQGDSGTEFGLVTWIYDNPMGAMGDTLLVTIDEQDAGAIRTIRLMGYNARTPAKLRAFTGQGIHLLSGFTDILTRYGYPDRTEPVGTFEFNLYYFSTNVTFHLLGSPYSGKWPLPDKGIRLFVPYYVTSITVGPGPEAAYLPPGSGGTGILVDK